MIDLCLLGTGGTMPLTRRWLSSLIVRYQGHSVLIDCGEGTQIAAQRASWSLKPIDKLLITHLHADHISGLPGLLLSMGNMGKTEPLSIIGPKGVERVVKSLCCIAPNLPFEIRISELEEETSFPFLDCDITAFRVQHGIPCYGYSFSLPRKGKFAPQKAQELAIPLPYWSRLQQGETIDEAGYHFNPEMVLGPERRGLKLTYCTDTRPTDNIVAHAQHSDLFICEGMYPTEDMIEKAELNGHMLFSEAAELALKAEVQELWLTHFSPSLPNPYDYKQVARAIFPNSHTPRDGWEKTLHYKDESAPV